MAEKSKISNFCSFKYRLTDNGELPKIWLYITKIILKGFILFHIAVLDGHVAMKNGGLNMAEKRKRAIFQNFQQRLSANGRSCQNFVCSW